MDDSKVANMISPIIPRPAKNRPEMVEVNSKQAYEMIEDGKGLKHLYKFKGKVKLIGDDALLSLNLAFYSQSVKQAGRTFPADPYDYAGSYESLKQLSSWALRNGPRIKDFELLVGIEQMFGWRPDKEYNPEEDVKEWVQKEFKPNYMGSEEKFYTKFREKVREVLRWKEGTQKMDTSAEDYCTNMADTGTSGSAFDPGGPRMEFSVDGTEQKTYNNKFAKSAVLSVKNKIDRLFRKVKQKCKISTKIEIYPKVRLIISSDFDTSLKMRFIELWLKKWMQGNKMSTLWLNSEDRFDMWNEFTLLKTWACPIDQSAFDHHVSKMMVQIVNEELKELIKDRATNNEEMLEVMDCILFALDGGDVIWEYKNKRYSTTYKNGVLSGWQWTAFYDTIINIAEHLMALDMLKELDIPIDVKLFNAQGDDQLLRTSTAKNCLAYWAALSSMGLEIHISKNFFSRHHDEYLRRYTDGESSNGYPARMVNSMMWLYPGTNQEKDLLVRLANITTNWVKYSERLKTDFKRMIGLYKSDAAGAKIPAKDVEKYLHTSRTRGGSGMLATDTGQKLEVTGGEYLRKVDLESGQGYRQFKLRFGQYQDRELNEWCSNVMVIPDKIKQKDGHVVEIKANRMTEIVEETEIMPLEFVITPNVIVNLPRKIDDFPYNTIFSTNKELIIKLFPDYENFKKQNHAPDQWVRELLTGKAKIIAPRIEGLSEEFSSLLYQQYSKSLIMAMLTKQTRGPEKWNRLQLFVERYFSSYIRHNRKFPRMLG